MSVYSLCMAIRADASEHVNILARKSPNLFPFPGNYTDKRAKHADSNSEGERRTEGGQNGEKRGRQQTDGERREDFI